VAYKVLQSKPLVFRAGIGLTSCLPRNSAGTSGSRKLPALRPARPTSPFHAVRSVSAG
jgi:hypothetical protein